MYSTKCSCILPDPRLAVVEVAGEFFSYHFSRNFTWINLDQSFIQIYGQFYNLFFSINLAPNNSPIERPSHRRTIKIGDRWTRNAQSKIRKIRKWSECFENRKFKIRS
jgi:hypothetical protein